MLLHTIALAFFSTIAFFAESVSAAALTYATQSPNTTALTEREPLGINCRGSSNYAGKQGAIPWLHDSMDKIDDKRRYANGEHIVCSDRLLLHTCAFLQKVPNSTHGVLGTEIKHLFRLLDEHGCDGCGSVPVSLTMGINDVEEQGELTVNYVLHMNSCDDVWAP
jgi:hypothetical protein